MSAFPEPLPLPLPFELVCIIDTSALIKFKRMVDINEQWDLLLHMTALVERGCLAFPRQVVRELAYGEYPDAPGAWIGSARRVVRYPQPSEETLREVLAVAEQLVDTEATSDLEVADPYIAAMACEIGRRYPGSRAVVATDDYVDRLPAKLSLATACRRLSIDRWTPEEFIKWVRADVASRSSEGA